MSKDSEELDLYADDIDEFSVQEYNNAHDELYNDALTPTNKRNSDDEQKFNTQNQNSLSNPNNNDTSNNNSNNNASSSLNSSHHNSNDSNFTGSYKKPCVYIGNLTWWTTDDDVRNGLNSININDVIEVKFFENRSNGQSKGFCVVTMQSENSVKVALDKFKNCLVHNQHPIVTLCNRQNLNNFEMKSRKPGLNGQNHPNNSNNQNQNNNQNNNNNNYMNNRNNYNQNHMQGGGQRPPLIPRPMRPNGPLLNQPRLVNMSQSMQFGGNNQQSWPHMMSNGPRNALHSSSNQLNPLMRLNQNTRPMSNQPLLSAPSSQVDLRTQMSTMGNLTHSMNTPHSALFSNPQSGLIVPPADIYSNARIPAMGSFGQTGDFPRSTVDVVSGMQMSEAEFEEIISKNKNLSTNAISKALNDATTGDYPAALDTLTMAISLIKGSRVSHDDRCKAIIVSLQDTYQGISAKAHLNERNSSSDRRDRNDRMARSRSRDRGGSSHRSGRDKDRRDSRRDRSRSRDRDYRERSRDRYHEDHRSYEDRYRDKDRDHGRHRH